MKSLWTNNIIINIIIVMSFSVTSYANWLQDLQSGRTLTLGDGLKVRVDKITDGVNVNVNANETQDPVFGSRVLKLFVGDTGSGITIRKQKGNDGLQFGLFTKSANGTVEARGKDANVFGVLLPLLIGSKIAGSIVATLLAVLVVSVKAFLASIVALLLTASLALKKFMMGHHDAEVHYPVEFMPHHPYDYPSAIGYNAAPSAHGAPSAHSAPSSLSHPSASAVLPSSFGTSGHEAVASDSNISAQYTSATAAAATTANTTPTSVLPGGGKRRVFKRKYPIVPILTVHKITRQKAQ